MKPSDSNHSGDSNHEPEAERFVPDRDGPELAYEHVHRYMLAAKLLKGMRVLDLAAGSGYGADLLKRAGCHVTTLDLDPESFRHGHSGVCADAQVLPLRDGSFEAVVCFEAIEHVADPEALVREVQRVLCDRSIFLVSTPDRSIYRDRAGHRNPYHVAEMDRTEFATLLNRTFEYVRLSGQGLWAGSWITALDEDTSPSTLRRRKVDATRWETDHPRSSKVHARWASPKQDELPVPVYLFAACSNSTKGWNRIKRQLSTDSVLHDPSQWLLAQYERLVEESTGRNEALEGQIDRARLAHGDLLEQLRAARATIDEQLSLSDAARSSMNLLEEEIRTSQAAADRQFDELLRARSASDEQSQQLDLAREAQEDLQSQLAIAARDSADHADEIARSRSAIDEKERALAAAKAGISQLEDEIGRARESIDQQRLELERAESGAKDMESQIEAARSGQTDLQSQLTLARSAGVDLQAEVESIASAHGESERQLERLREELAQSRSTIDAHETEIAAARRGAQDMERQIEKARTVIEDKEREIDASRRAIEAQKIETIAHQERVSATEGEIRNLEAEMTAANARNEDLERANARFWSRTGHRLADWFTRSSGTD